MKEKLIVTLWKAQFKEQLPNSSLYCRLAYNNERKDSKHFQNSKSIQWKQTFLFSLAKEELTLRIDFITLNKGQQIHFAKDNVAETMSSAHASMSVSVNAPTNGSLPAKMDILDEDSNSIGKVFIQYEVLKTEVTYLVEKEIKYDYLLKISNFRVNFVRALKRQPNFYLKLTYGDKVHREDFPFGAEDGGVFYYNYPVKLYLNNEAELRIELQVKEFFGLDEKSDTESLKSGARLSENKSQFSSLQKRNSLEIGLDKISAVLDLNFKENTKNYKKLSLVSPYKKQSREIGFIQFQLEAVFKSQQQKQAIQELQKKHIQLKQQSCNQNPEFSSILKRKRPPKIQPSNGMIILKTIMGRLDLFNDDIIKDKDISISIKLGKQCIESSILQNPGKQLIFIDEFIFKRTWEETIKFTINLHDEQNQFCNPAFQASTNLRQLFDKGYVRNQKAKIVNQFKQLCGQLVLQIEYQGQQKKIKVQKSKETSPRLSPQKHQQKILRQKKQKMAERIRQRIQERQRISQIKASMSKSLERDVITMSDALDLRNLILPPLKNRNVTNQSRYSTLSPTLQPSKPQKFRSADIYNSNGGIKFSRSQRFNDKKDKSTDSFVLNRESDFDCAKKRGAHIGYGSKHDFTKNCIANPGIGKYSIPTLWDKYN